MHRSIAQAQATRRRPLRPLAAVLAAAVVLLAGIGADTSSAAGAEGDLPAGFTDGVPVGDGDRPPEAVGPVDTGEGEASDGPIANAGSTRYFGRGPWDAIAAAAGATDRSCTISDSGLRLLAIAPVFKESSAATTPSTAPSPMTLSRYDEWSGTYSTTTNRDANYGLYAFRNPSTSYRRAYWHPGIGIWQYDSAGVGAPFTAIERMDVSVVGADVLAGMAARYCSPSASLIGHSAPFSDLERRYSAWTPWGYPCTACEREFQAVRTGTVSLVDGISSTGGAEARTCALVGSSGTVPCWYVDPSVGVIEGATAWATLDPSGGSSTVAPTPLAEAFYVLERDGREERHWLREDTGYAIDVSGTRLLGKNERPRADQVGSGVTWSSSSGLCDLTASRGRCLPQPPAGVQMAPLSVGGTYRPIPLDGDGDDRGDVLWYAPGTARDTYWDGQGGGAFTATPLTVNASYSHVEPLDVDGDGDDDVLWYDRTSGKAYLWRASGLAGFVAEGLGVPGTGLVPLVVDRDGDGADELLWYGAGSTRDVWWSWEGDVVRVSERTVSGSFLPFVGDFDGNGREDVFWYAPGPAKDALWLHTGAGSVVDTPVSVSGLYRSLVGDLDGDGADDIVWYAPGGASDALWFGGAGGRFARSTISVSQHYQPVVADLEGDGRDDVLWYAPGADRDPWWRWSAGRSLTGAAVEADGAQQAIVGAFSAGGTDGVLWYAPGAIPDAVWYR